MFSPLRFVKWKDPFPYQSSIRNRLERDTFSHNTFSLSFGKHVAAYEGYLKAQDYLSKKSQDTKILLRALRHLPRLTDVIVVSQNEIIGAREIMSAFGLLNGNEVTLDSEYTLPVLIDALSESELKINKFRLVFDDSPPFELFCESRREFNDNHEPRFKYISERPANITIKAFWNAFRGDNNSRRQKVISLMSGLREFAMNGLKIESDDNLGFLQLSSAMEPVVAFAYSLEELSICPSISGNPGRNTQRLQLSCILHESICLPHLQCLMLRHVEFPESLLVNLLIQCSSSLVHVELYNPRISGNGSWSDFFRKLRNAKWKTLQTFVMLDSGATERVVRAQTYLKRITDKDPIVEANEADAD